MRTGRPHPVMPACIVLHGGDGRSSTAPFDCIVGWVRRDVRKFIAREHEAPVEELGPFISRCRAREVGSHDQDALHHRSWGSRRTVNGHCIDRAICDCGRKDVAPTASTAIDTASAALSDGQPLLARRTTGIRTPVERAGVAASQLRRRSQQTATAKLSFPPDARVAHSR